MPLLSRWRQGPPVYLRRAAPEAPPEAPPEAVPEAAPAPEAPLAASGASERDGSVVEVFVGP